MNSACKSFLFYTLFIFGGFQAAHAQLDNLILKQPFYDFKQFHYKIFDDVSDIQTSDTANSTADSSNLDSSVFTHYKQQLKDKYTEEYHSGFSFGNLFYCKNNEYGEPNNPGQTFFGNQIWFGGKHYFTQQLSASLGSLIQYDFGDDKFPSKFLPIFNLQYNTPKSRLILGSLMGNTNHNLIEPIYNYENTFTKPVEYGVQYFKFSKFINYQAWLDWRQFAKVTISQQEKISFGQTALIQLLDSAKYPFYLAIPGSLLVYHQGGEALNVPQKIQTNLNGSIGFRLSNRNQLFRLESFMIFSNDVSPSINHAFKNGNAYLTNLTFLFPSNSKNSLLKIHRLVGSYYRANEFYSPLGAPLFTSELYSKPYLNTRNREIIMMRYQYETQYLFKDQHIYVDFRVEPIYHVQEKLFAFSTGVYLKIHIGNNFIH